jgi:hypothetical protein
MELDAGPRNVRCVNTEMVSREAAFTIKAKTFPCLNLTQGPTGSKLMVLPSRMASATTCMSPATL